MLERPLSLRGTQEWKSMYSVLAEWSTLKSEFLEPQMSGCISSLKSNEKKDESKVSL